MVNRHFCAYFVHVFLPLLLGALIYIALRQESVLFTTWIPFTVEPPAVLLRWTNLNPWILYNLPDILWLYAFIVFYWLLWVDRFVLGVIYSVLALLIAIGAEYLQRANLIAGTYDVNDISFYLGTFLFVFFVVGIRKLYTRFKV